MSFNAEKRNVPVSVLLLHLQALSEAAALPMPIHKHRNFAAHSIGYLHSSLQYAKASYVLSHNTDPVSLDTPNALAPKQILMMQEPVPGCDNPYPPCQSKADLDRMHVLFLPPISTAANHHFLTIYFCEIHILLLSVFIISILSSIK